MQFSSCLVVISHVVLLHCTVKITKHFQADIRLFSLPYRAIIGRFGVWPSAQMATTSCPHPTINPCVCGRGPGSPSSWRRNGRWWGGRGRRRRFNSTRLFVFLCACVSKQPCFRLDRSEKQSLRRAWLKGMSQWWATSLCFSPDITCDADLSWLLV